MCPLAKTSFIGRQMFCRLRGWTQRSTVVAIALAAPHQSCLRVAPGHLQPSGKQMPGAWGVKPGVRPGAVKSSVQNLD
jgi:hypothetical protein